MSDKEKSSDKDKKNPPRPVTPIHYIPPVATPPVPEHISHMVVK